MSGRSWMVTVVGLASLLACDDPTSPRDSESASRVGTVGGAYTVSASNLSATVVSWAEIDVSWASNPSATGFEIWRSTTGPTGTYGLIGTASAATRSYANVGLTASTNYCYQVRSFKTAGKNTNYSAFVGPVCATTLAPPVAAPSETEAIPQATYILIKWKDNSANEDGFRVEQAAGTAGPWTVVASPPANTTSAYGYVGTEQQACFRVTAFNAAGPSLPSTPDCTVVPSAPSDLAASSLDGQSVTLTWKDNSAAEDGYEVRRTDAGGAWSVLASLPANSATYRDATVAPDIRYRYAVRAIKDGGYSQTSNEVSSLIATTVPAAPQGAVAFFSPDYDGSGWLYFTVAWADASSNEQGFRIEYSSDGVSGWSTYATADADATYFWEQYSVFDGYGAPVGCYRVVAFNSKGDSPPSNASCADYYGPTDLAATTVDQQTIDLAWSDNALFETGYYVARAPTIDGDYSVIAGLPANTSTYRDTGLDAGQEYWYVVIAVYDGGVSLYSNVAGAITSSTAAGVGASRAGIVRGGAPTRPLRIKGLPPRAPAHPVR